jgi:hypothetical protein
MIVILQMAGMVMFFIAIIWFVACAIAGKNPNPFRF